MKVDGIRNVVEELKGKVDNLPSSNSAKEKGDLYGSYFDKVGQLLSEETKIGTPDSSYKEYLSIYQRFAKTSQEISEIEEKRDANGIVSLYENYFNELGRELESIANAAISGTIGGAAGYIIPKTIEEILAESTDGTSIDAKRKAISLTLFNNKGVNNDRLGQRLRNVAANGNIEAIKLLVDQGADINAKENDEYGRAPLHLAAINGHAEAVKLLVELGSDIDVKDNKYGRSPLHWAALNGHVEVIKTLVDLGANVNAKDNKYDQTPLHFAATYGNSAEAVKVLREFGGIDN